MAAGFLDFQSISAIVFIVLLTVFLIIKRKYLAVEKILYPIIYIIMYRTKLGIKAIDRIAKRFKGAIAWISYAGIFVGFLGMAVMVYFLVKNIFLMITIPAAAPTVGLVLPFKVKGAFYVPFFYWIISIFIIAVVHEFSHGIVARRFGLKIKSSGFAVMAVILPIIPAAFVEPDEKKLLKSPKKTQLSVFAAGPFSNILLAFVVLALTLLLLNPIIGSMVNYNGVEVAGIMDGDFPAKAVGMSEGEIITAIDNQKITTTDDFTKLLADKSPGDKVLVTTDKTSYSTVLASNPANSTQAYLGIYASQSQLTKPEFEQRYTPYAAPVIFWIFGLFYWLFILNLGIGLFNLVPIGPIDGGRMVQAGLEHLYGKKRKAKATRMWKVISLIFLALVLANLAFAFIK